MTGLEFIPLAKKLYSYFVKSDKDKIIEILHSQLDKCETRYLALEKRLHQRRGKKEK